MKWSFSASRIFARCHRKWYFSEFLGQPRQKDPYKKEAYLLKQLQSVEAWRGSLVDDVITRIIVPAINKHRSLKEAEIVDYAMRLADMQLEFGKSKRYRDPGMTKSGAGEAYCALYDIEYNGRLKEERILRAKEEIKVSLHNLLSSDLLDHINGNNPYIIAQRSLRFHFAEVMISSTPDAIVFFKDKSPLIIDWKVHAFANVEYRMQLGVYAIALTCIKPHKDFPDPFIVKPEEIDLIEYQLLKNHQRDYALTVDDVIDTEDYMFQSIEQMNRAISRVDEPLRVTSLATPRSLGVCGTCQFKKLCWEGSIVQKGLFGGGLS